MSRFLETFDKNGSTFYRETLDDAEGCAHQVNDVCCNDLCEFLGLDLIIGVCDSCLLFEPETADTIEALRTGIVSKMEGA